MSDIIFDGKIDEGYHIRPTRDFMDPEELFKELLSEVAKYHPSGDTSMLQKAYDIAYDAHKDQVRKSGEPYIIHPLSVAIILAQLELDKETIVAGILHDVLEDTVMSEDDMRREFGDEVVLLVDGVTKLAHLHLTDSSVDPKDKNAARLDMQAENLRKMFLAMAKDIRVILIKLADRLHNMRTLQYQSKEAQIRIARETMDIYSPIARRLGISKIKIELDDLSLKYLEPEAYQDLVEKIDMRKGLREEYVRGLIDIVKSHLIEAGIEAQVEGRVKHFFSIYKKMVNQGKTLDQIYDLFAIRILVADVKDCYAALGVMHEMYKPIPGRIKDYIAMPKSNMYQSLHTTLIGPGGRPFEIQIRTYEMHRTAEYGIAAHWKYKEGSGVSAVEGEEEKLSWLKQILEWQQDMSDNKEFMSLLKSDLNLFSDTVFCFTPTGEVKNLPYGSNTVDFAYSVHSAVGNKMVGAKVNGRLVPIDYVIQNGDRVEIITSQNSKGPSRDWLTMVRSAQAKNKINQWFKSEFKEENIQKGRDLLEKYATTRRYNMAEINKPAYQDMVAKKYGFSTWEATLASIGHGAIKESAIANKLQECYNKDHPVVVTDEDILEDYNSPAAKEKQEREKHKNRSGIIVRGLSDVAVHVSKCCSPVPGDEIIGFVTRGRGVTVHRTDCVNVINMDELDKTRLIEAEWDPEIAASGEKNKYQAGVRIYGNNRTGLLVDITKVFTERGVDIRSINCTVAKNGVATLSVSFDTSGKDDLTSAIERLRNIESVIDVERTSG